jgi:DNA (cytosine-5)-methyltransferase 1
MITATDLFCGGGGSSEGLRQAGLSIEVAANHWPLAVATHALNHPGTEHRTKDLSELDWRTFPRTTVLWGSPSCRRQGRAAGRKAPSIDVELRRDDAGAVDRATAFAIIAAAEVHLYPVIIVENVPEFTAWTLYPWWLEGLRTLGYAVEVLILDAADFGHAQNRKRMFAVATRGVDVDLTLPTVAPVTASEILASDPGRPVTRRLYVSPQIDEITDEGVPHLVTYRRNARARRADRHQLATVTAGGNHHAIATIIDGVPHHRLISNPECARAQGFGDEYRFLGKPADVKKQIGNAVPVGIARWLGTRVAAGLGVSHCVAEGEDAA